MTCRYSAPTSCSLRLRYLLRRPLRPCSDPSRGLETLERIPAVSAGNSLVTAGSGDLETSRDLERPRDRSSSRPHRAPNEQLVRRRPCDPAGSLPGNQVILVKLPRIPFTYIRSRRNAVTRHYREYQQVKARALETSRRSRPGGPGGPWGPWWALSRPGGPWWALEGPGGPRVGIPGGGP